MLPLGHLQWNKVHECQLRILSCHICILFIPSEVITKLANTIVGHEIDVTIHYYYQVTLSNTHHPPHMVSHTSQIRTSNKERGNNMHLLIHQEHDKDSHLIVHPIK
jgi:hypothetical protein